MQFLLLLALAGDITGSITTNKGIAKAREYRGKAIKEEPNLAEINDIAVIWNNILSRIKSRSLKEFLWLRAKLASVTISSSNALLLS